MASIDHQHMPAIVLGRGATGLGILRSLRLAGIPAYVACPPNDMVARSRWYQPTPGEKAWDGAVLGLPEDVLGELSLARAVLIPGADDAALWLADIPQSALRDRFLVSSSSRPTLEVLQDKIRFAQFLSGTDIPYPRTFGISCSADVEAMPFDELDRVFIKPANSQRFSDILGVKGIWAHSQDELAEIWHRLDDQGFKLMAQEYVPGSSADHYFIDGFRDKDGVLTGLFARRRIRIYPPDFGNSSYCRSIPLHDVEQAANSIRTLLAKLDYRGIFSVEFKRDARDGQFRILEVNTRAWTYVEFATRCGVNVCEMAYRDAQGLPVLSPLSSYSIGSGCVNLYRDINAVREGGEGVSDSLAAVLWQWINGHFHCFRFDDPKPGLTEAMRIIGRYVRRRSGSTAPPIG